MVGVRLENSVAPIWVLGGLSYPRDRCPGWDERAQQDPAESSTPGVLHGLSATWLLQAHR